MPSPAALFDWDDTLHQGITLLSWARFLQERSFLSIKRFSAINALLEGESAGRLSYEQFAEAVVAEYAQGLVGMKQENLKNLAEQFIESDRERLFHFVRPLLDLLRSSEIKTIVISGCPQEILDVYRNVLGLHVAYGCSLSQRPDGTFSGGVEINPALGRVKEALISDLSSEYVVLVAMGNTDSDWPLLRRARLPLYLKPSASNAATIAP